MFFNHSILGLLITLTGGSEYVFYSFYTRIFTHSILGLLITLAGGLEYVFNHSILELLTT